MKVLYLMHVPWGWIKQRPHFLAEELSADFEVDVYCKYSSNRVYNKYYDGVKHINVNYFFNLPYFKNGLFLNLNCIIQVINNLLFILKIGTTRKYKFIWVTNSLMFNLICPFVDENNILISDCMDDELEFPSIRNSRYLTKKVSENEKKMYIRSDLNLFSSEYLAKKVFYRNFLINHKMLIINNALKNEFKYESYLKNDINLENNFVYIGTISQWFDFELVLKMLNEVSDVKVLLYGPTEVIIPEHSRLIYKGIVKHEDLPFIMNKSKALIMPFKLTELIKSVNPVKLYEYICANKPIIALRYGETLKFENYVYLYSGQFDFFEIVLKIKNGELFQKNTNEENHKFIDNNRWSERYKMIYNEMRKIGYVE